MAEVAVIGVPDPKWGEVGCAVIVPRPEAHIAKSDIADLCSGRLARFKTPAHIIVIDELPRNGAGKVLKHQLRKMVETGDIQYS